ncbi:hypothetical protein MMC22_009286 [Lobaria immixta]|nr:hypothetical protein [Lobaria immixta]
MAATIPAALKAADIARFAQRAGQLEKAKPIVAYWCNYWIVNQILTRGLHNSDDESMTYTMHLMDKLEQSKADHHDNDAVVDDLAGQAYVEQFGTETLSRAENAMKLNKVTRQTADTFLASATFLELCQIWGPLDPEVASKIKYAKYHSLRIARAIKAGEDPNLSNPAPVQSPAPVEPSLLEPGDPDFRVSKESRDSQQHQSPAYQPSVEDVPDEQDRLQPYLAQHSVAEQSLHPSRTHSSSLAPGQDAFNPYESTSPKETESYYNQFGHNQAAPPEPPRTDTDVPDGGGYFPRIPDPQNVDHASILPEIPSEDPGPHPAPDSSFSPPATSSHTLTASTPHVSDPYRAPSLHSFPPPTMDQPIAPENPPAPFPSYPYQPSHAPRNPPQSAQPPRPAPQEQPSIQRNFLPQQPPPSLPPTNPPQATYLSDEEAILNAQKHARWAISALNFEDVKTAVKELRGALESLGAT